MKNFKPRIKARLRKSKIDIKKKLTVVTEKARVVKSKTDLSFHRWTIDYEEDLQLVRQIFSKLNYYNNSYLTSYKDVLNILDNRVLTTKKIISTQVFLYYIIYKQKFYR